MSYLERMSLKESTHEKIMTADVNRLRYSMRKDPLTRFILFSVDSTSPSTAEPKRRASAWRHRNDQNSRQAPAQPWSGLPLTEIYATARAFFDFAALPSTSSRRASALSVFSHSKPFSSRPKWPYAAVGR